MDKQFTCTVCGKTKDVPKDHVGTGYGLDENKKKMCYECCALKDKIRPRKPAILPGGRAPC